MIGRYAVYGAIASGGMATVHLGRLLGPVGFSRTVAIKKLHPNLAQDPDFVLAFVDEARVAARIRHPNVVPTIDVIAESGHVLLVMEYVAGESLQRLLRAVKARKERTPPRIAAAILSSACHGLHAAHEATADRGQPLGIVHRDVSPHNILVGSDGVARVLDFGVAKAMGRSQNTAAGTIKGKVAYMAPEQIAGGKVDRRSDVYAAGIVLWEALAGRRLFKGESDVEVFGLALAGCKTPPGTHAPGLPPAFDALVMKALHLDPAERFATAREMALELEACAGIATPSEVAAWVSTLAADLLDQRARAVAEVESASDIFATAGPLAAMATEAMTSTMTPSAGVPAPPSAPAPASAPARASAPAPVAARVPVSAPTPAPVPVATAPGSAPDEDATTVSAVSEVRAPLAPETSGESPNDAVGARLLPGPFARATAFLVGAIRRLSPLVPTDALDRRRRLAWTAAAAMGVLVAGIGLLALHAASTAPSPDTTGTATVTPTATATATATATVVATATATATSVETAATATAAPATASATTPPAPVAATAATTAKTATRTAPASGLQRVFPEDAPPRTTPPPPRPAATPRPGSAPGPNCVPPYTIDPRGFRVLKPECM